MIEKLENTYILSTNQNSYVFRITKHGDAESVYYGKKITSIDAHTLIKKQNTLFVNTLYMENDETYGIDGMRFEYSFANRGDSRSVSCILKVGEECMTDFVVKKITENTEYKNSDMPVPRGYDNSLTVKLEDALHPGLIIELWYFIYENTDVLARAVRIQNDSGKQVTIQKLMSAQYDLECAQKELVCFHGAWGRERIRHNVPLCCGKFSGGSHSGMSSAECNPFFIVKEKNTDENVGEAYGFHLVYSASHELAAETDCYRGLRISHGIQSEGFCYALPVNEKFDSPISISTFSACGLNGISYQFSRFINANILPKKQVPIMLNSWEAFYFDINEKKLYALADEAERLGFEGIVIDDGWFLGRNDDTGSLGDWQEDKRKFPLGIAAYAKYLSDKKMQLGIWIEPEMVSEKSNLFLQHPEWVLKTEGARSIVGREQRILDLTNSEVCAFIEASLDRLVEEYGAKYIKWDFNRRFSDIFGSEGSAYFYRYIKQLYLILKRFTFRHENVVIENCASGGGRFDLGMLSYCHVGWVSDNTDSLSRAEIQQGTSYGYPIRTMLNHISASPNQQSKRCSSLKTRSDTAMIGMLGAQLDITALKGEEKEELKRVIEQYKKYRTMLLGASLFRISSDNNFYVWEILSDKGENAIIYLMMDRFLSVSSIPNIKLINLDEDAKYEIRFEGMHFTASGKTLMNGGLVFPQIYQGVRIDNGTLNMTDRSTLLIYLIKKEDR